MRSQTSTVAACSLVLLALLGGCGHPASREECEEIFDRSAELELRAQNVTDPKVIAQRTAEARTARGEELMSRCLGRRITTSALECVRKANTSDQVDRCLE